MATMTQITEKAAMDAFYAHQRGLPDEEAAPGAAQLGYLLNELQMFEQLASMAKSTWNAAVARGEKVQALSDYADALQGVVNELSHDFIPGMQREHRLTLVNDKKLAIDAEVVRVPEDRNWSAPYGKVIGYVPGGYEVRWEGVARSSAGALSYENDETVALRYPEEA